MNAFDDLNDSVWNDRYNKSITHSSVGSIIEIKGVGDKDTYNPCLCNNHGTKILAFRCENRNSEVDDSQNYHPTIMFAKQSNNGDWQVTSDIKPLEMLEDPSFAAIKESSGDSIVIGGVKARAKIGGGFDADTLFFKGSTLETIDDSQPFAVITGMKDERLRQLPDGRILLCRRPLDNKGIGHVAMHILNKIDDLKTINESPSPQIFEIDGTHNDDWVGINNIYMLRDKTGVEWIGLLGHIGCNDDKGNKHYAATTYKIKFDDLLNSRTKLMTPNIIATRSCFPDAPEKEPPLSDVVFPGSLERLENGKYRLWAGLSDARIGILDLDDPFGLNS